MSEQCLFVQAENRLDKNNRASFVFTVCKLDKGLITSSPINIWQREDPNGDFPEVCPFVACVDWSVRQYSTKEGGTQTQPFIVGISDAQPVEIPPPLATN